AVWAGPAGTRRTGTAGATRRGLVHADHAAVERMAVERRDRAFRLLGGGHLDEAEASRASRLPVGHHGGRLHLAEPRKRGAQTIGRGGEGKTTDEQLHGHDMGSFRLPN